MKTLFVILILAISANAQSWHGHPVQPGSTTPQCMIDSDPDHYGFENCNLLNEQFTKPYLQKANIIIYTPKGYKAPRAGAEFWWTFGIAMGAIVFDEEEQQRLFREKLSCNAAGQCFKYREADPLLGQTRYQAYGVFGAIGLLDYWQCKKQRRYELLRSQEGLPKYSHTFWAYASDWRLPLWAQTAVHLTEGIKASHKIQ